MKKFVVFCFVISAIFFSLQAEEKKAEGEPEVLVEEKLCSAPGVGTVVVRIKKKDGKVFLKEIKCPAKKDTVVKTEEEKEEEAVPRLIRVDKNWFYGSVSYRLVSEGNTQHHIPIFSGGFMSYPFLKQRAGVKIGLGYGIPANSEGWRHMMEWKLQTYVILSKNIVNLNVGYYGSFSWGDTVSRNESGASVELEYFPHENFSISVGGTAGGTLDYLYEDSWEPSGGFFVGVSTRW